MFSGWADSPPELLLPIFRAATILIGLPLYAGPKLFDFPGDPGPELDHKTRRASIIMKRRLPSVCKSWYQLATPYLYEHITIRRVSSLPGLSTALSRQFTTDSGKSVSSLGCWTKRLDIVLEDVPYDNHDRIPEILESLARIIENLPNLNIVVFRTQSLGFNDVHLSSSMIRALAKCGASLQAVNWYTGELQVASDDWITFVQAFPNLRALQLGHGDPRGMYCKPLPNTFTLSSVSTLSVDCKSLQQLQSSLTEKINLFPNVRQLICDYPRWEYQEWVSLLEIYGKGLQSVVLSNIGHHTDLPASFTNLRRFCPSLTVLAIKTMAGELTQALVLPPTVRVFGIRLRQPHILYNTPHLIAQFLSTRIEGDQLKLIRFNFFEVNGFDQVKEEGALRIINESIQSKGWICEGDGKEDVALDISPPMSAFDSWSL